MLLSGFCFLGTETTRYIAVGKFAADLWCLSFIESIMVELVSRLLFRSTVRTGSGCRGVHRGG